MKKYLFLALAAIVSLVFASCSEELSLFGQGEDDVDVTYTVSTQSVTGARATHDGDGAAANVNRYICEVWHEGSDGTLTLHKRIENVVGAGTLNTSFKLRLVSKQSYKVLFWADHAEVVGTGEVDGNSTTAADIYYDTKSADGLRGVTLKKDEDGNYVGNNDELDAFYAVEAIDGLNGNVDKTVILKRPFAQLNVITTDVDDIRKNAVSSTLNPNKIKMNVNAPTKFNVLSGEASEEEDIEYTAAVYYNISGKTKKDDADKSYTYCTLAMNYFFAPADEKAVETVKFVALNADKELVTPEFANIPLQRNYRTNIIGDLLTDAVNYHVTIDPLWIGEKDVNITRVDNIAAANAALAEGLTNLEITMADDAASQNVVFTTANNAKEITLNFTGDVVGNTITIKNDDTATGPASVNITAPAGTNLVFQNETHVVLNGQDYGTVSGSFSANTLVISEGVTVRELAPSKGKIEIHGTVNTLNLEGSTAVFGKSENISDAMKEQIGDKLANGFVWKKTQNNSWDIVRYVAAKIGNKEYFTLQAAIEAATPNDIIELFEGTYTTYGTNYAKNKTLHFKGMGKDKTTWEYCFSSEVNGEGGSDYSFEGATVSFEGIAMHDKIMNSNYRGFVRAAGLSFKNCSFDSRESYWGIGKVNFENCDFNDTGDWNLWAYSGKEFTFKNCNFYSSKKGNVNVYQESASNICKVTFDGCSFTLEEGKSTDKPVVQAGEDYNDKNDYTVIFINNTISGSYANGTFADYPKYLLNKNNKSANTLHVKINGTWVYGEISD